MWLRDEPCTACPSWGTGAGLAVLVAPSSMGRAPGMHRQEQAGLHMDQCSLLHGMLCMLCCALQGHQRPCQSSVVQAGVTSCLAEHPSTRSLAMADRPGSIQPLKWGKMGHRKQKAKHGVAGKAQVSASEQDHIGKIPPSPTAARPLCRVHPGAIGNLPAAWHHLKHSLRHFLGGHQLPSPSSTKSQPSPDPQAQRVPGGSCLPLAIFWLCAPAPQHRELLTAPAGL